MDANQASGRSPVGNKVFCILKNATSENPAIRRKCAFVLIPALHDGNSYSNLDQVIYELILTFVIVLNAGEVLQKHFSSENAVTILEEKYYFDRSDEDCELPPDTFSSVFIYDVDKARKARMPPPDLNRYRLTGSKYLGCDANKVLFHEMKWSDLPEDSREPQQYKLKTAQQVVAKWKKSLERGKIGRSDVTIGMTTVATDDSTAKEKAVKGSSNVNSNPVYHRHCPQRPSDVGDNLALNFGEDKKSVRVNALSLQQAPSVAKDDHSLNTSIMPQESDNKEKLAVLKTDRGSTDTEEIAGRSMKKRQRMLSFIRSSGSYCTATSGRGKLIIDFKTELPPHRDLKRENSTKRIKTLKDGDNENNGVEADVTKGISDTNSSAVVEEKAIQGSSKVANCHSNLGADDKLVKSMVEHQVPAATENDKSPDTTTLSLEIGNTELLNILDSESHSLVSDGSHILDSNEENLPKSSQSAPADPTLTPVIGDVCADGRAEMDDVDEASDNQPISGDNTGGEMEDEVDDNHHESICGNNDVEEMEAEGGNNGVEELEAEGGNSDGESISKDEESTRPSRTVSRGLPFTRKEGQQILNLICDYKAFLYIRGIKLWKLMQKSGRFPRRTYLSLKERYRKHVLPNILKNRQYKISQVNLRRLKKAQKDYKLNKYCNVCPDYDFSKKQ